MPIFLWSTVVNHDQKPVVDVGRRSRPRGARAAETLTVAMNSGPPSLQLFQIRDERIDLVLRLMVVRHVRSGLARGRIRQPRRDLLGIVIVEDAAGEAVAARKVRE